MINRKIIKDDFFDKSKKYESVGHTHTEDPLEFCDRCKFDIQEKSLEDWIKKTDRVATRNPDTGEMEQKPVKDVQVVRGRLNDVIGWAYSH